MKSPIVTYDPKVKALYLKFSETEIAETLELSSTVYVDIDTHGQLVGFEILNADSSLTASLPSVPDSTKLRALLGTNAA
jgi:uncharacterized protein YuzE